MENNNIRKIELIEANDPAVSVLAIGFEDFVPERYVKGWEDEEDGNNQNVVLSIQDDSIDWKRVCTAIQRSKILKELQLSGIQIVPDVNGSNFRESDLRALMNAFANSERQLTKLALNTIIVLFAILFSEDCPGVLQKPRLRIEIAIREVTPDDMKVLVGHVSRGNNLVRFEFESEFDNGEGGVELDKLIKHLTNHQQLEVLRIVGARLTPPGIQDIASMLQKPDSKLVGLELSDNGVSNGEFKTILESLSTNKTLRGLSYDNYDEFTTRTGVLLIDLRDLRLKMLSTSCMIIDDLEAAMLSKRFDSYGHLTYLEVKFSAWLTMSGWNAFGDYIQSSRCILDQLNLPNSQLDDAKLQSLSSWISSHGTLKYLHLDGNRAITVDGWRVFSNVVLENPKSKLKFLDISDCRIEDETIEVFANALRRNRTLEGVSKLVRGTKVKEM